MSEMSNVALRSVSSAQQFHNLVLYYHLSTSQFHSRLVAFLAMYFSPSLKQVASNLVEWYQSIPP